MVLSLSFPKNGVARRQDSGCAQAGQLYAIFTDARHPGAAMVSTADAPQRAGGAVPPRIPQYDPPDLAPNGAPDPQPSETR